MRANWWRTFFLSRGFLVVCLLLLAFLAVVYGRAYYRDRDIRREIGRLQSHVQALEDKKLQSAALLQKVKSPEFLERIARLEFGLAKPGEKVVVVTSSEAVPRKFEQSPPAFRTPSAKKWWYYFFNKSKLYGR